MKEDLDGAMGVLVWEDIEAIVVPSSSEGFGIITTADPEVVIATVPLDVALATGRGVPRHIAERRVQAIFAKVNKMLVERKRAAGND